MRRSIPWSPLLCFGLAWLLMETAPMQQLAWRTLDWRTKLRAHFQSPPDPRIEIILFGDETEMHLVPWPPDRAYHGMMAELLSVAGAKVQSWDVLLDSSREGDGDLNMSYGVQAAMDRGSQVITGSLTDSGPLEVDQESAGPTRPLTNVSGDRSKLFGNHDVVRPFPLLRAVSWHGVVDAEKGDDGIIREIPLVVRVGEEVYPSFALQTLIAYYGADADAVEVRLGEAVLIPKHDGVVRIPITDTGRYFINYRYDHDDVRPDFPTESYVGALLKMNSYYVEGVQEGISAPDYQGKIVFIGQTVTGRADSGPTPRGAYSPLVLVHANLVNNVLAGDYARKVPDSLAWSVMLAIAYGCVWLGLKRSMRMFALVSTLAVVGHLALAYWGWIEWSLWFPWIGPLMGLLASLGIVITGRVREEQRAKQEIKGMFGSYLSPTLIDRMIQSGKAPRLGGHESEITAYFSDVQGFSTFSEQMSPERLVELMNEYLTACTDIVQEAGGTLDKYIGDAVVAMYGAPLAQPNHAYQACLTAIRVQEKLEECKAKWRSEGDRWPSVVFEMQTRIGINTGPAIVGNMGSRSRFNYTMMGDNVNLAARMESGAKRWGVYTMCTEATKLACEAHDAERVVFRPLGRIVVQGRSRPTPIYEIVGLEKSVSEDTKQCLTLFDEGLQHYHAQNWSAAENCFRQSAEREIRIPERVASVTTNPSLVYLEIVARYKINPPPADWDGVYVMQHK